MRAFAVHIVVEHLAAGHSATVFGSTLSDVRVAKRKLLDEIEELGLELKPFTGDINLANGATIQFAQLQDYDGRSLLHTPVVVIINRLTANQVLVPHARAVACSFPDGKNPILIEC
jgi:hypothetical protein